VTREPPETGDARSVPDHSDSVQHLSRKSPHPNGSFPLSTKNASLPSEGKFRTSVTLAGAERYENPALFAFPDFETDDPFVSSEVNAGNLPKTVEKSPKKAPVLGKKPQTPTAKHRRPLPRTPSVKRPVRSNRRQSYPRPSGISLAQTACSGRGRKGFLGR
jgi:hypothetical protein